MDIASLVPPAVWDGYWRLLDEVLAKLNEADAVATEVAQATRGEAAGAAGVPSR